MHTAKMNILALNLRLQCNFERFTGALRGVANFLKILILSVVLKRIVTKFGSLSSYISRDLRVHTNRKLHLAISTTFTKVAVVDFRI